jgi:hypothetical protein
MIDFTKISIRLKIASVVLALPMILSGQIAPAAHKPVVPLNPDDVIKLLPPAPTGWTTTQSNAKNYFIGWLCCQATREFQHPSPANPSPGEKPPPPLITRVRLMDTGYFPTFNGDFENFRVGKYPGAETLVINGMPARKFFVGANHERVRISIRGRFIVEIETENQPANSSQSWLQIINFPQLSRFPDSSATTLPRPIHITKIDEMNPKNNSTTDLFWSGNVSGDTNH